MRLNSAFELSVQPVDIKLPEIPLLEVSLCERCGGEEVWPQRGLYPFVELDNPCECTPRAPYVGWRDEMDARRDEVITASGPREVTAYGRDGYILKCW